MGKPRIEIAKGSQLYSSNYEFPTNVPLHRRFSDSLGRGSAMFFLKGHKYSKYFNHVGSHTVIHLEVFKKVITLMGLNARLMALPKIELGRTEYT